MKKNNKKNKEDTEKTYRYPKDYVNNDEKDEIPKKKNKNKKAKNNKESHKETENRKRNWRHT